MKRCWLPIVHFFFFLSFILYCLGCCLLAGLFLLHILIKAKGITFITSPARAAAGGRCPEAFILLHDAEGFIGRICQNLAKCELPAFSSSRGNGVVLDVWCDATTLAHGLWAQWWVTAPAWQKKNPDDLSEAKRDKHLEIPSKINNP